MAEDGVSTRMLTAMSTHQNFPELEKDVLDRIGQMGRSIPDVMQGFMAMHDAAVKDGALSAKVKELISPSASPSLSTARVALPAMCTTR